MVYFLKLFSLEINRFEFSISQSSVKNFYFQIINILALGVSTHVLQYLDLILLLWEKVQQPVFLCGGERGRNTK